ncbi:MAG: hypothetical protein ACOYWZ_16550, partial [Bacillota bacterium]
RFLLGDKYIPRNLIVFESRWQRLLYNVKNPVIKTDYDLFPPSRGIFDVSDQNYIPYTDTVELFCYYHYGKPKIQIEILRSLAFALRVRHYYYDYLKAEDVNMNDNYMLEDIEICNERTQSPEYTLLIERFVDDFMHKSGKDIRKILLSKGNCASTNQILA